MKRLVRSAPVQWLLSWLITLYVEVTIATLRWTRENDGPARDALARPDGILALFWHGRIVPAMSCRPILGAKPRRVMISLSRDGGFIARAAERLRIPTIRGSTGKAESGAAKGGATAYRQALNVLAKGGVMILTPDGPRGPDQVMQIGPVQMARVSGKAVFMMGLAAAPALRLGSWDRGCLPAPFARAAVVFVGPLHVSVDADETAMEAIRADWQDRLRAAQQRAEALVARRA